MATRYLALLFKVDNPNNVKPVLLLHLNIVVYAAAFWLTNPLLPYRTKSLGVDRVTFGYMQSAMEVAQIVSSLYFGQVIDKIGSRSAMALAQGGTALAYFILASAFNVPLLFLSRVPTVFMACMLCAQGAMPTFVGPESRAAALGRLSVSYALGMILGSTFSGTLSRILGFSAVGYMAAAISVVMALLTLTQLPATQKTHLSADGDKSDKSGKLDLSAAATMCLRPALAPLVAATCFAGLALSIHRSQLSVLMADHYHIDQETAGRITAMGGILGILANTVGVSTLRARYSERQLLVGALVTLALSFTGFTICDSAAKLLTIMVPITLASTTMYTVFSSLISNAVERHETGTAVSISHSVRSAVGIIAPPLGGYLLTGFGVSAIGLAAAALMLLALPGVVVGAGRAQAVPQQRHKAAKE